MRAAASFFLVAALASGCASRATARPTTGPVVTGRASPTAASSSSTAPLAGHGTADDPFLLCLSDTSSGPRTDYTFVSSWHCADGSVPLGGDPMRGAGARVGNVGAGPDGHIVDLYRVPCGSGPVDLYVDAYHCGDEEPLDIANLTANQLVAIAQHIRAVHSDPSSAEALEMRRFLLVWTIETAQISVVLCNSVLPLLPTDPPRPYMSELMLSLAASVIEDGRDPVDAARAYLSGFAGLVTYYQASLAEDPSLRDPQMDQLVVALANGTLGPDLATRVAGCDLSGMGVHFVRR